MASSSDRFFCQFGQLGSKLSPDVAEKLSNTPPFSLYPFKERNQSSLSVRRQKLDAHQWLTVDVQYPTFHAARKALLDTRNSDVIQCLPGQNVQAACQEALHLVVSQLTSAYPEYFSSTKDMVHNHVTGESFQTGDVEGGSLHALEIAARLAKEDFNILLKQSNEIEHRLVASATLFPAGWVLQDRIGWTVTELHKPVPGWDKKLGIAVERAFGRIGNGKPVTITNHRVEDAGSTFERLSYFVQVLDPHQSLDQALYVPDPTQFFPEKVLTTSFDNIIKNMIIRRERQTFRRLSSVDGVLFSVNTFVTFITDLPTEEVQALAEEVRGWSDEAGEYKGRHIWAKYLIQYAEQRVSE